MRTFITLFFGLIATSVARDISISTTDYTYSDYSSEEIESRITGGTPMTKINYPAFKYQVGLLNLRINYRIYLCGGSLIHTEIVLTAAHCVLYAMKIGVFWSRAERPTDLESCNTIVYPDNIRKHNEYKVMVDDIALLRLSAPVTLTKYLGVIPLASGKWTDCDTLYESEKFWLSGWGIIGDNESSTTMHYVEAKPKPIEECKVEHGSVDIERLLCTTHENNQGFCEGDSGGPYAYEKANGTRYLCGIVAFSWTPTCVDSNTRGMTRVSYYHDNNWICENSDYLVGC